MFSIGLKLEAANKTVAKIKPFVKSPFEEQFVVTT